jgi:hypothetical protein
MRQLDIASISRLMGADASGLDAISFRIGLLWLM